MSCVEPAGPTIKTALVRSLTYDQLYLEVAQAAGSLRDEGVGLGDRVAALVSNNAILERFTQVITATLSPGFLMQYDAAQPEGLTRSGLL